MKAPVKQKTSPPVSPTRNIRFEAQLLFYQIEHNQEHESGVGGVLPFTSVKKYKT